MATGIDSYRIRLSQKRLMPGGRTHLAVGFLPNAEPIGIDLRAFLADRVIPSPRPSLLAIALPAFGAALVLPFLAVSVGQKMINAAGGPKVAPAGLRIGVALAGLALLFLPIVAAAMLVEWIGPGEPSWAAEERREAQEAKRRRG